MVIILLHFAIVPVEFIRPACRYDDNEALRNDFAFALYGCRCNHSCRHGAWTAKALTPRPANSAARTPASRCPSQVRATVPWHSGRYRL